MTQRPSPLPWMLDITKIGIFSSGYEAGPRAVAICPPLDAAEAEANARLIVRAANMHQRLLDEVQTLIDVIERGCETQEDLEGILEYSRSLLKEGGQS